MTNQVELRIPVSVDKSHLVTLGRKMYAKSIDLLRELVNNAYDADATEVKISLTREKIVVEDNGSGMDLKGLQQYFTIGPREKAINNISPILKRKRIGELGIGKFSSLGAATKFEIITRKGEFLGHAVFDQKEWDRSSDDWSVPLIRGINKSEPNGTSIVLFDIEQQFTPQEIADRLRTSVPLNEKDFRVFINGVELKSIFIHGRRIKVDIKTQFGEIEGQLIIADKPQRLEIAGIECKVKNVMITKSLFGFEGFGHGINRIAGYVNADFLLFNSARDNFLANTEEYRVFYKCMKDELSKATKILKMQEDDKQLKQSSEALRKASQLIDKAFRSIPELTPVMNVNVSSSHKNITDLPEIVSSAWRKRSPKGKVSTRDVVNPRSEYKIPHVNPITEDKVLKRIKSDLGIRYGFVNEGLEGVASYFMDDAIWVNREHKLYKYNCRNIDQEVGHLVRILMAETVMLTQPADARQAYEREIKLLSAAYV